MYRYIAIIITVFTSTGQCLAASSNKVDGVCGSADGVSTSTTPTTNLCSVGKATSVSGSGPWTWQCLGSKGGSTASCSAPLTPPPSPTLTLTFSPANPSIPETSSLGTFVATVTPAWSDGSAFTGQLSFVAPYYDDGGTFAMSGNQLVVSPSGMGVNGDGGTVQNVSIQAIQ